MALTSTIAWNTGTCLYMAWTALGLLVYFVNSVVWHNDAINYAPVWCDISASKRHWFATWNLIIFFHFIATKLIIGISVAIPAASLCINRRLYYISTVRTVTRTRNEVGSLFSSTTILLLMPPIEIEGRCSRFSYWTWHPYPSDDPS